MESEFENPELALLGLTLIAAVPVVIFSLWADYFEQQVHQLMIKRPVSKIEWENETEKIRTGGFLVILFELSLFLGSVEIRNIFPVLSFFIFGAVIIGQIMIQNHTQNKITPEDKQSDNLLELGIRAALSWLIGITMHLFILGISIKAASIVTQRLNLESSPSLIVLILGGVVGLTLGLLLNFVLGPFHFRRMLPSIHLEDENVLSQLRQCFDRAKIPSPDFWIVNLKELRIVNVLAMGPKNPIGPLRPTFFICKSVLKTLAQKELNAIVLNEISHVVLSHARKRFLLTTGLIVATAGIAVLAIILGQQFLPREIAFEILGPAVAFASFIVSLRSLAVQNKKQELEGDIYSVEKLGVPIDDLVSALRKLSLPIDISEKEPPIVDTETELRIYLLQSNFPKKPVPLPTDSHEDHQKAA